MNSRVQENILPDLATIALDRVEGFAFERYIIEFLSSIDGSNFIPMGELHDGGADGLYECENNHRIYYQFTRQENHRAKIRQTHKRLEEFGRTVKTIYYYTSRKIDHIDQEEDKLSDELGVIVRIRDRKFILGHLNDSVGTISAYINHLSPYTKFLESVASEKSICTTSYSKDPSTFVFLQHETTNRLSNRKLIHSVTDTMILWALSETDPDKKLFMTESEIEKKIFDCFPWTVKILKGHINQRLKALRSKQIGNREINWYNKQKYYCLPYSTRESINFENMQDEVLRINFLDELKLYLSTLFDGDDGEYRLLANLTDKVLHMVFENQGLLFTHFISTENNNDSLLVVSDCIDEVLVKAKVEPEPLLRYRDYLERTINRLFYKGSPTQRKYLNCLSKTYVLLFTLQAEPKIVEYFSNMGAHFNLFLGSDILVKALSERYLAEQDQVARNLLKMAAGLGMNLSITEGILEEVYTHITGTDFEFLNKFNNIDQVVTAEIARHSKKILIRAYYYAKFEKKVGTWPSYINQFITYINLHTDLGREELKKYLIAEYNLTFVENEILESVCNIEKVHELAKTLIDEGAKEKYELAYNTALLVHGVYGVRKQNNETTVVSEYGFKTWWMTNQTIVQKFTADIVRSRLSKYIMRPDFVLNFIAMSPKCEEVRKTFKNIFPSTFGIQLGHRLKDSIFKQVLKDVDSWKDLEEGRVAALMSDLSDKLKVDRLKRYNLAITDEANEE